MSLPQALSPALTLASPVRAPPAVAAVASWVPVIEAMLDAVWLVDARTLSIVAANTAAGALFGTSADALHGRSLMSLAATPEDLAYWSEVAEGESDVLHSESHVRRFDGTLVPVLRRVSRIEAESPWWLVVMHDHSEARRAVEEREVLLGDLQATLESTTDGLLVTDLVGGIRAFNKRFAALWNLPLELLTERNDAAVQMWMRRSLVDATGYVERLTAIEDAPLMQASDVLQLNGARVLERVSMPQCSRGLPVGRVYSFRDITERVASSQRIEALSHTDALTGLPNRLQLAHRFEYAFAMARRDATPFASLVLDIDRFRHLNDTFGQHFGDRVLVEVAERIKTCLREVDTVARLGADQFALLLHDADARGAEGTARRLLEAMSQPFSLEGISFTVTCSIGVSLHPTDGSSMDDLLKCADAAMHRVKDSGRASYRFHQPRKDVDLRAQIRLDHAMRQALPANRFRLHYQPQIDLRTGAVVGAEALIRWRDPELGDISPGEFIPVAEQSGFIVRIGDWVLFEAVNRAAAWLASGLPMRVSINVSALQFQQHNFVGRVQAALQAARLPAGLLELELTESILIADAEEALARLRALDALGVHLAIDDFGTGFSSLGYLKRFPLHRLKIDRSFVRGLPDDSSDAGIAHAIINLARALGLAVVAEGVETEGQRDFLRAAGCDQFQGFLYAPALPHEEFERRVRAASAQ